MREWTMRAWISWHDESGVDNTGVDNVAQRSKRGQRGSGQRGSSTIKLEQFNAFSPAAVKNTSNPLFHIISISRMFTEFSGQISHSYMSCGRQYDLQCNTTQSHNFINLISNNRQGRPTNTWQILCQLQTRNVCSWSQRIPLEPAGNGFRRFWFISYHSSRCFSEPKTVDSVILVSSVEGGQPR